MADTDGRPDPRSAGGGHGTGVLAGVPWLAIVGELSLPGAVAVGFLPFAVGGAVTLLIAAVANSAAWAAVDRIEVRDTGRSGSVV